MVVVSVELADSNASSKSGLYCTESKPKAKTEATNHVVPSYSSFHSCNPYTSGTSPNTSAQHVLFTNSTVGAIP